MKPLQQVFALVLEKMKDFKKKKGHTLRTWKLELAALTEKYMNDQDQLRKKIEALRNKEVKSLIFDKFLKEIENKNAKNKSLEEFFK